MVLTADLRKRFAYPVEDSDDERDSSTALDEEEQEQVIARLREAERHSNEEYKRLFLTIPIVSAVAFIPFLAMSNIFQVKVASIMSMTSLICSSYILMFVSNSRPSTGRETLGALSTGEDSRPLRRYLVPMNGALSIVAALNSIGFYGREGVPAGFWALCFAPIAVFLVILVARRLMREIDIDGLEEKRYPLKGA